MKHFSSNSLHLSIPTAGGTLPIPEMRRVQRRAQTGSPDLCSSAAPAAPCAKQQAAASRTAGKGWAHQNPLHPETQLLLSLSAGALHHQTPQLDILGSACLPSQCLVIQADQPGPESLSLVPSTWRQGRSHQWCHGVSSKQLLSPWLSEHSSPPQEHLEGLKAQPVQRKARILTHQDQRFSMQELWAVQLPHVGKGQKFYCPKGN